MLEADTATTDDRARVVTTATLKAADALHIGKATLGRILGLSPASVSRLAPGWPLRRGSKPYELARLLLRGYRWLAGTRGGDRGLGREGLESENGAPGGRRTDGTLNTTGL